MTKPTIIIQARGESERYPYKIYKDICGKSMLCRVVDQCKKTGLDVVIATDSGINGAVISAHLKLYAEYKEIPPIFISYDSVLIRYIKCATNYDIKYIIRVCADNPLIDVDMMKYLAEKKFRKYDYVGYWTRDLKTPMIQTKSGLVAELVSLDALNRVNNHIFLDIVRRLNPFPISTYTSYIENVTQYIYDHEEYFNILKIPVDYNNKYKYSVDTEEDLERIKNTIEQFGEGLTWKELIF